MSRRPRTEPGWQRENQGRVPATRWQTSTESASKNDQNREPSLTIARYAKNKNPIFAAAAELDPKGIHKRENETRPRVCRGSESGRELKTGR
jgi:hypothetical protein